MCTDHGMFRFKNMLTGQARAIRLISLLCLGSAAASTFNVIDESDLAAKIALATGPNTTTLVLPSTLTLTKALPVLFGPVQLVSVPGGAVLSCQTPNFTALTINASSFDMSGLTWVSCGTVLVVNTTSLQHYGLGLFPAPFYVNITIDSCNFRGNRNIDPTKVR